MNCSIETDRDSDVVIALLLIAAVFSFGMVQAHRIATIVDVCVAPKVQVITAEKPPTG